MATKNRLSSSIQEPKRTPTVQADVVVPVLQGVAIATPAGIGAALVWWQVLDWRQPKPWVVGVFVFLIAQWLICYGGIGEMRQLMWKVEEAFDIDISGDNVIGQPTGRTIINPVGPVPDAEAWDYLNADVQVADVIAFAELIWQRYHDGLKIGQKEFRELGYFLPSGFKVTDDLHRVLFGYLQDAGLVQRHGNNWRVMPVPRLEKRLEEVFVAGK